MPQWHRKLVHRNSKQLKQRTAVAYRVEQGGGADEAEQVRLAGLDSHVLVSAACGWGNAGGRKGDI